MKIPSQAYYGIKAVTFLAQKKNYSSVKEISEKEHIPYDYLEKIMQRLVKEGIVEAKKGFSGGYLLKKSAKKIKVGEVFAALDKDILPLICLLKTKKRGFCLFEKTCLTKNLWYNLQISINKVLNSTTLADLIYARNKKFKRQSKQQDNSK